MPATLTAHPSSQTLHAYGLGQLDLTRAAELETHLDSCPDCLGALDDLSPDTFVAALRAACAVVRDDALLGETSVPYPAGPDAPELPAELQDHARYRVLRLIGRGGMGAVYQAEHTLMARTVALKVIAPRLLEHDGAVARFGQEVKTAARLQHPNIVTAFDAEQVGPLTVLVMEYVEGRSLAEQLDEAGPLPIEQACAYVRQVALGLQYAHEQGMVHRDIKPHNLMLTPGGLVKILDFGLARFVSEGPDETPPTSAEGTMLTESTPVPEGGLTSSGICMGTLDYVAPEQARDARTADARADLYSLGCTLYHLLTGQVPFPGGSSAEKLARLTTTEPTPVRELRPDVPPSLAALVGRLLAKRPEDRCASATAVADALAPFTARRRPARWRKSLVALIALLVVLGPVLATVVVRIATEQGEVVIETDDTAVEVVVKGDRIVRIRDPKTGREYALDRRDLSLSETDGAGLQVTLDGTRPIVLRRHGATIATVRLAAPFKPFAGHTDLCRGAVFAPDATLYTCSDDGTVRAWDPMGREVRRFNHGKVVRAVALAEGGRTLLTVGEFGLRAWEATTGRVVGSFPAIPSDEVLNGVAVSPDGTRAATIALNGMVRIWDVAGRKALRDWKVSASREMWLVAWSPNGQRVASAGDDWIVRLAEPGTGKAVAQLDRVGGPISSLAFTADSEQLVAGCFSLGVRVIDCATGAVTALSGVRGGEAVRLAVAPGGGLVVAEGRRVERWDATGSAAVEVVRTPAAVTWVAVSPDGSRAAAVGYGGTVTVAALTAPLVPRQPPPPGLAELWQTREQRSPRALAVSPDGKWAYSSGYDNTARQWNLATRQEARRFAVGSEPFDSLALSSTGDLLFLAHHKLVARLWDADSGREIQAFKGHVNTVSAVALSPDSKRALTGAHDNTVRLWDVATGAELKRLTGHAGPVRAVAFLPGNRAVSGGHDRYVRVWNLDTGETTMRFGPFDNYVLSLAVAPGGKQIVVNEGTFAALLDRGSGRVTRLFSGHAGNLHAVALSPDGRLLATGGYDRIVRVWEFDTGRCIAVGTGHTDYVVSLAFVGNAQLVSAGDHTIRLWELPRSIGSGQILRFPPAGDQEKSLHRDNIFDPKTPTR